MVCAVECWTHQVGHARVEPHVSLVRALHVAHSRDEVAVWTRDAAAALHVEAQVGVTFRDEMRAVRLLDACADLL